MWLKFYGIALYLKSWLELCSYRYIYKWSRNQHTRPLGDEHRNKSGLYEVSIHREVCIKVHFSQIWLVWKKKFFKKFDWCDNLCRYRLVFQTGVIMMTSMHVTLIITSFYYVYFQNWKCSQKEYFSNEHCLWTSFPLFPDSHSIQYCTGHGDEY